MKMRDLMRIVEGDDAAPETPATSSQTPARAFLEDLWEKTHPHPFMRGERLYGSDAGWTALDVRRDIDDDGSMIWISSILSLEAGKKTGLGRAALVFLLHLADQHGVTLILQPKAYGTFPGAPKTKALKDWYVRYGFRPSRMEYRRGDFVRPPGSPIPGA